MLNSIKSLKTETHIGNKFNTVLYYQKYLVLKKMNKKQQIMNIRPILNYFNRCFLICGLGSINYNQRNFKTAVLYYVLRCSFIFCGLKTIYDSNKLVIY